MNEQTIRGQIDYDKCEACGRDLRSKPTPTCRDMWHEHAYERYKETAKLRNRKSRALKRAEESAYLIRA